MSLTQHIHTLTRPHLSLGPDNKHHARPALLVDLQHAVQPGSDGTGSASASRPLPINAGAVDLIQKIKHEAHVDHVEMRGFRFHGTITNMLHSYLLPVFNDLSDEWESYLEHVTLEWIDAIEALVRPRKPRRKLSVPCPRCGEMFHGEDRAFCVTANCWDEEGDMMATARWDIRCEGCDTLWTGEDEVKWFLSSIGQGGVAA